VEGGGGQVTPGVVPPKRDRRPRQRFGNAATPLPMRAALAPGAPWADACPLLGMGARENSRVCVRGRARACGVLSRIAAAAVCARAGFSRIDAILVRTQP